jgi:PEP-CTERM motif
LEDADNLRRYRASAAEEAHISSASLSVRSSILEFIDKLGPRRRRETACRRAIQVALRQTGKYRIRAKQGYFPDPPSAAARNLQPGLPSTTTHISHLSTLFAIRLRVYLNNGTGARRQSEGRTEMSRAGVMVGSVFVFASLLGASTLDIPVSPNSSLGCTANLGNLSFAPVNCPSNPFLLSVLRNGLTIGFDAPGSATYDLSTLDSLTVDLSVADNPGLFGKQFDALSEGGSVYLVVGSSQFLLGNFGGGSTGLNAYPIATPLALTLSVAPADLPAVFADLKAADFVFGLKVARTSGDFEVIDAAGASAELQGVAPEPATVGLIGLGLVGLCALRRRRAER